MQAANLLKLAERKTLKQSSGKSPDFWAADDRQLERTSRFAPGQLKNAVSGLVAIS
jgi:hypothetical protein